jgi:hypothetical protein
MTYVLTQVPAVAAAAADVTAIGSAISAANTTAAGATTGVAAAAGDEVSAAAATLFTSYAREYQALLTQAGAFHDEFAAALAATGSAYSQTEAEASTALGALTAPVQNSLAPLTGGAGSTITQAPSAPSPVAISLILGASGIPIPDAKYVATAYANYISRDFTTSNLQVVPTPEGLYPITGVKSLPLNISVDQGLTILNNAILQQYHAGTTPINVFGYSQGAILAALELPKLQQAGIPTQDVSFVLVGNEMTPNGGLLARFPDLNLPSLGIPFYGGMPANTGYAVYNYTLEYDGFADFPRYPIDFLADLNAVAGITFVHPTYLQIPQSQVNSAFPLPTSPGYDGGTTYYMIPTQNLPLLDPLRAIPYVGNPLADLLQPDLRYLVNWGYGDPSQGWSTGPANITTPFGLFPPLSATAALPGDLVSGTQQGIVAAAGAFHAEGPPLLPQLSLPGTPQAALPPPSALLSTASIDGFINNLMAANTNFADALTSATSTAYATLLPTADIANALVTTLPSYDANLFLNGISQAINGQPVAGLVNAIGEPIAADVGLTTVAGGVEFLVLVGALATIVT